jgi:tetratricopeptide (TPR) repeat protein
MKDSLDRMFSMSVDAAASAWKPVAYLWKANKRVAGMFVILKPLAHGGFGQVYVAYDEATGRNVAIKIPHPQHPQTGERFVDHPGRKASLIREVRNWIELAHPNIVHAFDIHDDQDTGYLPAIFMDYCEGGSVRKWLIPRDRLSLSDRLDIAIQVCWAMEYAHENGLVHLDLKPDNVLLIPEPDTRSYKAKVTDFGISKAMTDTLASGGYSPPYAPPEQWDGKPSAGSDIYAFGVMLYEMVCDRMPFIEATPDQLRLAHQSRIPTSPGQVNSQIPDCLSSLVLKCLEKDPQDRPEGFGCIADQLARSFEVCTGRSYAGHRQRPAASEVSRDRKYGQACALVRLGIGCRLRGDLKEAVNAFGRARELYTELDDKKGLSACLGNQALILKAWGRLDEAMDYLKQDETLCRQLGDKTSLSACLGNQALILQDWGRLKEAMDYHKQEEALCRELGDKAGLSRSLGNQALILKALGRLDEAMDYHKQEGALCRDLGDKAGAGMSSCLCNQALILKNWGRLDEAMDYQKQSEALCRQLGDKAGLSRSLGNQALILEAWGRLDEAMEYHKQEEALCRQLNDKAGLSICLCNQAVILIGLERLDEGMEYLKQQEALCRQLGDVNGLAHSLVNRGSLLGLQMGKPREGLAVAREGYALASKYGLKRLLPQIQNIINAIQQKLDNPD